MYSSTFKSQLSQCLEDGFYIVVNILAASIRRLHCRHNFSLKHWQHIGVTTYLFLNDWIVVVVTAGFKEKAVGGNVFMNLINFKLRKYIPIVPFLRQIIFKLF